MQPTNQNTVKQGGLVDVRQSMKCLPVFSQWFLTWLTGKPLKGQQPLVVRTNFSHFATAYAAFFGGIAAAVMCYTHGLWFCLPIGWIFAVSGARKIITTINHYCVHRDLFPASLQKVYGWLHPYIGDFNTSLLFLQNFNDYAKEHLKHHVGSIIASIVDPDTAFMWQLGFKAGMKKSELWRNYLYNLLVPFSRLHRLFLISRLKETLFKGNPLRYTVHFLVLLALVCLGATTSFFTVFWAYIFPMTYLYHMASLMQFSSEHLWLSDVKEDGLLNTNNNHKSLIARAKRITLARFCGEAFPTPTGNIFTTTLNRMWWLFKMLFVHLPVRLFVLPGDLVVHDWHHNPKGVHGGADWANALYTRQKAVDNLKPGEPGYAEVWGFINAVNCVFENLSRMNPIYPGKSDFEEDAVLGM